MTSRFMSSLRSFTAASLRDHSSLLMARLDDDCARHSEQSGSTEGRGRWGCSGKRRVRGGGGGGGWG